MLFVRLLTLSLITLLLWGCASSSKKYISRCSLRNPAIQATIQSRLDRLRANRRLKPMAFDASLRRAAQKQSNYLALTGSLSHADGSGGGPLNRLRKLGISRRVVGENIARVEHDSNPAIPILAFWADRPREAANLVNPEFFRMGLGVTSSERHCYAVLLLSD